MSEPLPRALATGPGAVAWSLALRGARHSWTREDVMGMVPPLGGAAQLWKDDGFYARAAEHIDAVSAWWP